MALLDEKPLTSARMRDGLVESLREILWRYDTRRDLFSAIEKARTFLSKVEVQLPRKRK